MSGPRGGEAFGSELQRAASENLWLHFTRMSEVLRGELPIIVRGEGCYLEDDRGRRYLDGLAGLFAVQIGYSHGEEIGEAAAAQMRELPFYTNWSYAHPRSIELAQELARRAPGSLNRAFFVSGGSEAVESAWKLARQFHTMRGERRWKAIARRLAYHGTTLGALSLNGLPPLREPFQPLLSGVAHVWNTNRFHRPAGESEEDFTAFLLRDLEEAILAEGPETVAMVILEPVQNGGGAFMPPAGYFAGVRDICDRYGILLCADEVITAFGRLGAWSGAERFGFQPDLMTCAKGLSSAYASIGAVVATDEVFEAFRHGNDTFGHGITFGGHPVQAAIALKNLEIMEREDLVAHVRRSEGALRAILEQLRDEISIVGDVRGCGYFLALELVRDDEATPFSEEESEELLRGFLSHRLFEAGLICRTDDRGDPVIQIAPPLIAGQEEFDRLAGILGEVLTEADQRFTRIAGRVRG